MYFLKKIRFIILVILLSHSNLLADVPYFLDFKYILNQSEAGKKAQVFLKNKLDKGIKQLQSKEKVILEEEKKLIAKKKIITPEEYKKKVNDLRNKVSSLQKNRNKLLEEVAIQRKKARQELLDNLNPIIILL